MLNFASDGGGGTKSFRPRFIFCSNSMGVRNSAWGADRTSSRISIQFSVEIALFSFFCCLLRFHDVELPCPHFIHCYNPNRSPLRPNRFRDSFLLLLSASSSFDVVRGSKKWHKLTDDWSPERGDSDELRFKIFFWQTRKAFYGAS